MLTAVRDMEKYPSVADDSGTYARQGEYLATRTVNAFTGSIEWPHQLMAYALAGHKSYLSSDHFWYVFPHQLVAYAAGCVVCPTSSGDEYCDIASCDIEDDAAKRSTSGVSAADEICFQREHSAHNYDESLEADDVQRHLEILVAADVEDGSDDQSVTGGARKAHARMFTADKKVFFVTQPESYRHRGVWLEAYSPTEFEMIVDILPRVPSEPASVGVVRGRPKRRGVDLAPDHTLSPLFQGFIRAKFRTPMLGGAPLPPLKKNGPPSDALGKYIVCLMDKWGLDSGRPERDLSGDGLVKLCVEWNSTGASFINRSRYRVVENILQKTYRCAQNEKTCSEWRSRNVQFWADPVSSTISQAGGHHVKSPDVDMEAVGAILPEDIFDMTIAAAAKDIKAVNAARAMKSTFLSLSPMATEFGTRGSSLPSSPAGGSSPHEAIYMNEKGAPSLSNIARRVHVMLAPEENQVEQKTIPGLEPRGGVPSDYVEVSPVNSAERDSCSADQRALFDRIVGSIECGGKMRQTLTMLHGGGGTGKSMLMRKITKVLRENGSSSVNTCPTGIGACHLVNVKTFHSAFKVFRREGVSRNDLELLRLTFTDRVGVVVVDEVSMFSAEFLVLLDHRLRTVYKNNIVFGGRSIILVGDFLQLDVIAGVPLCKVLYMNTRSDVLLSARALFRQFKVFFLHTQHRAATCQLQLANLAACRALPRFIPSGQRWTESESAEFRPMTADVVKSLTPKLTMEDVLNGPAWLDETTVIVTSNVDKAILTAPAAALFADRHGQLLFRWKRRLRQELPVGLQNLVYD
ncbi:PIF1-like helicase [Phytophthora infestans]|uniref:ATP-dependent DNA helicase n=1 Tax=Phytophthora infestans TaxID=4787 RepID=A0A833WQW3_PHYIN|nr:PIF1-like helicase [Phytophthora infestans]KAF4142794.1 PIF1-like helicase [Phytophthora infestans]